MSDSNGGYARIYRSIFDNPTFRNAGEAMFFAYLVLKANWRAGERRYDDRVYKLERGELVIGTRKLAKEFGWSHKKVRTQIKRLIDWKMVGTEWAQHGAQRAPVITICNYERFQALASERAQGGAHQGHKGGTPKKEGKEKESKKPTSGPISPVPSSDHFSIGGQKENDVARDGSSEDMFWSLVDKAGAVNITRGLMGKLAVVMADFDKAYPALLGALDKKNPPAYVAKIIKNEKQEQDARDAAEGRDSGEPGFVQEAYRAGQAVERLPEGTWRIAGTIYSPEGEEVGW